ncbi:MAG TPA: hypothetical protein VFR85_04700 [Anaeromyxobacteraceae bacterium]|nr:hypothetical protein [Anaeromyxobacteraceae bacterium]
MAGGRGYYRGIGGCAALPTSPLPAGGALGRAESLAPGELRRVPFAGELLGAARVRARFAAMPLEAFDRVAGVLAALEQAAYLQLLRLAFGEGRNFCRAGKRDLEARLGLSERRLNRVLGALVEKRFLRALHRDNRGTLWRVYLPREAFGEPVGDDVLLGRAAGAADPAPAAAKPSPAAAENCPAPALDDPRGVRELARSLLAARGAVPTAEALESAVAEVRELLADGASPRQVAAAVAALGRRRTVKGAA